MQPGEVMQLSLLCIIYLRIIYVRSHLTVVNTNLILGIVFLIWYNFNDVQTN